MGRLINEYDVETVAQLKAALANLPDDMPVSDLTGDWLCLRVYDHGTETVLEVG